MNSSDLVRFTSRYMSLVPESIEAQRAENGVETFWSDMNTPEKVALIAGPLLLLCGTLVCCCLTLTLVSWKCLRQKTKQPLPTDKELLGLMVNSYPPEIPRATELLEQFCRERWFSTTNPIGRDARIPPANTSASRCYKYARQEIYGRLKNQGLWTAEGNIRSADLYISLIYVAATGSIEEIKRASINRTEYLDRDKRYTAIILYDLFDLYRRAYRGLRTVTSEEGLESLRKTKGFDRTNFTTPGTCENKWTIWRDEILVTLETLFTEDELSQAGFREIINQGFPESV